MRLVKVVVPNEQRETVVRILNEEEVDYVRQRVWTGEGEQWLVAFPVPTDAIGFLLKRLREAGVEPEQYTTITSLESAITPRGEELLDRFANDFDPLTRPELRSKARDMSRDMRSMLAMTFISAVIAVAGLLSGSPAVVVGSMVIAPLVGPVLTASVGAVTGDRRMMLDSIWLQVAGVIVALVGALLVSYGLQFSGYYSPVVDVASLDLIASRTAPTLLTLLVGVASGVAVVFGLVTKGPTSLIGVMIAAALVPSAGTTGIAIAWGNTRVAIGSLLLLLVTLVAINVSALITLWLFGYRPESEDWLFGSKARRVAVVGTLAFVVVAGGAVSVLAVEQVALERAVSAEISDTLSSEQYGNLSLESVSVEYSIPFVGRADAVTVVIGRAAGGDGPPDLATTLARRLRSVTNDDVVVRVEYHDYQRARTGNDASALSPPTPGPAFVGAVDSYRATIPPRREAVTASYPGAPAGRRPASVSPPGRSGGCTR